MIMNGEFDYAKIRGRTGWLVYPAGHVYNFYLLYKLSFNGDFETARLIFIGLYCFMNFIIFKIYDQTLNKKNQWIKIFIAICQIMLFCIVERLFNDVIVMIYMYLSIYFLINYNKYPIFIATIFYGIALSVKMNVLLFLPGFLYVINHMKGPLFTIFQLFIIAFLTILIPFPFLASNATNYFNKSFDFSNVARRNIQ